MQLIRRIFFIFNLERKIYIYIYQGQEYYFSSQCQGSHQTCYAFIFYQLVMLLWSLKEGINLISYILINRGKTLIRVRGLIKAHRIIITLVQKHKHFTISTRDTLTRFTR